MSLSFLPFLLLTVASAAHARLGTVNIPHEPIVKRQYNGFSTASFNAYPSITTSSASYAASVADSSTYPSIQPFSTYSTTPPYPSSSSSPNTSTTSLVSYSPLPSNATTTSRFGSQVPESSIVPSSTATAASSVLVPMTHNFTGDNLNVGDFPITCTDCSTAGSFNVSDNIHKSFFHPSEDEATFDDAYFFIEASGISGHFEFDVSSTSFSHQFQLLPNMPILGYDIEDLGTVGVYMTMEMPVSLTVDLPVDLSFGFEYVIPDGAYFNISLRHLQNSSMYGFTHAEGLVINPLPITSNNSNLAFTFDAALQAQLLVGFSAGIPEFNGYANAGVTFALPGLNVTVEELSNVNSSCQAVDPSASTGDSKAFVGSATSIVPELDVNVTVGAAWGYNMFGKPYHDVDQKVLGVDSISIPTSCIEHSKNAAPSEISTNSKSAAGLGRSRACVWLALLPVVSFWMFLL